MYQRPLTSQELYHYGVIGMKWGVRRYQNPDGSLTAAGRRRYEVQERKKAKKERKAAIKNIRTLSDDDIQSRINRLQLEKRMKDLMHEDLSPGKKATKEALNKAGKVVAVAAIAGGLAFAGKTLIKNRVPIKAVKLIAETARKVSPTLAEKAAVKNRIDTIFAKEGVKREARTIFTREKMEKWLDKIDWDEMSRYMFPNPSKKK